MERDNKGTICFCCFNFGCLFVVVLWFFGCCCCGFFGKGGFLWVFCGDFSGVFVGVFFNTNVQ